MPKARAHPASTETDAQTDVDANGDTQTGDQSADLPQSYEAAMRELDSIAGRLESGEVPLEQLLSGYQRATVLMQFCKDRLQAVEEQIKVLDNGQLKAWKPQP